MQTFSGVEFYPLDPRPEDIDIEDIAHSLSLQCRYNGHCTRFYSVAEHCVHVSYLVPEYLALDALMHDAAEAYLGDVPAPIKPFLTNYQELEQQLERVIAKRFSLRNPIPEEVRHADRWILTAERDQVMSKPPRDWNLPFEKSASSKVIIFGWEPIYAQKRFLQRFDELTR